MFEFPNDPHVGQEQVRSIDNGNFYIGKIMFRRRKYALQYFKFNELYMRELPSNNIFKTCTYKRVSIKHILYLIGKRHSSQLSATT